MPDRALVPMLLSASLLSGCAMATATAGRAAPEPACSFRSATTCWTLAGRFPRREAPPPPPDSLRAPPQSVLASAGDTVHSRR